MPKITTEELTPVQIRMFATDLQELKLRFGTEFGVNRAVRAIVRAYLRANPLASEIEIKPKTPAPNIVSIQTPTNHLDLIFDDP